MPPPSHSREELLRRVGRLEQVAGVRLVTLGDGSERGVRVLEFRSGCGFDFDVLVDRGFDIGRCSQGGRSLAWISPTGFPGPWFAEPEGLGFLRGFGAGLLTTCGLDHAFGPAEDTAAHFGYPAKPTERYGLHGRVSATPARLLGYGEQWNGEACVLFAEGEARQATVFGEHLVLRRRVEVPVGESRLTIRDEVANEGFAPTTHMLLYHVNVGWPVVDEGAELLVPARAVRARGDEPTSGYETFHGPTAGFVEQSSSMSSWPGRTAAFPWPSSTARPASAPTRCTGRASCRSTSSGGCSARARTSRDRALHEPPGGQDRRPGAGGADRPRARRGAHL
jgi:hypothetical protein